MIFSSLDALVPFARRRSMRGLSDGRMSGRTWQLIELCTHYYQKHPLAPVANIIFTRDIGHHSSGWWKNPDYERCWHLSLSLSSFLDGERLAHDRKTFDPIVRAFFGDDARLAWIEGPYSPDGKRADVWHYRVFCDPAWQALLPRGEVYGKEFTEAGWRSFSEIHGTPLDEVDAPFLKEGAR